MAGSGHPNSLKTIFALVERYPSAGIRQRSVGRFDSPSFGAKSSGEGANFHALPWLFTATESNSSAVARDFVAVSRRAKALSAAQRTT